MLEVKGLLQFPRVGDMVALENLMLMKCCTEGGKPSYQIFTTSQTWRG